MQLSIRGLYLNKEVEILKDINLDFKSDKLYVITGPNGGGKSSLAKAIMGIYNPTSGKIYLEDEDITSLDINEKAKKGLGYAFQQPPRFKGLTVRELIELAGGNDKLDRNCNLLYDVGLCPQDYLDREIDASLSGGEVKRIELATLLARNLKFAFFDEPEAGIDLWSFSKLEETFEILHKNYPTTIILISHQERILSLADEIIVIDDGIVKERGAKDEILPALINQAYCSCPQDCQLERSGLRNVEFS